MSNYNDLEDGEEYIISIEDEDGVVKDRIAVLYEFSDGIEGADQFTPKCYQFAFDFNWIDGREFDCDWIEVGSERLKSWKRVDGMFYHKKLKPFSHKLSETIDLTKQLGERK